MSERRASAKEKSRESPKQEDVCLFCPCCSSRLLEMKCKLLCAKCGYYMSCADYH